MYNLSFEMGIVPEKLKIGKIVPIYKGGDSTLPSNYRPISILSVFNKLIEKLIAIRLNKFLEVNDVLYKYQFGFRKTYSTVLAVVDVMEDISEHLDKNDTGIGIYFDLKKLLILLIIIYFCISCITMVSEELCMNGLKVTFITDSSVQ